MKRELHNSFLPNDASAPFSSISFVFDNTGKLHKCLIDDQEIKDKQKIDELIEIIKQIKH